jgi:integrase
MSSVSRAHRKLPSGVREKNGWYYYRTRIDGRQKELRLGRDLTAAKQMAKEYAARYSRVRAGLEHSDSASWMEALARPISVHVEEWHKSLVNRGSSERHASLCRDRVLRLLELAGVQRVSSLEAHSIEEALADLKRTGLRGRSGNETLSDRSVYHHGRAVKSFSRWLRKTKRCESDRLVDLTLPKVLTERKRQALQSHELEILIETTRTQPCRAGIGGEDRSVLYATAAGTGYRLGELQSLTPESFDLGAEPPMVVCQSAYTKNGREARQPIRPELADMLRLWLIGKAPGQPVFVLNRLQAA